MKHLFTLLILATCIQYSNSQTVPSFENPTPETASFQKYTHIPVSHHTGLPEISVPIYTINSGGISIPLSLVYHAQGIRVDEIASRYGLGWNLSGAGAITREVKDKIDEYNYLNPASQGYYNFVGLTEDSQRMEDFMNQYSFNFEKIKDQQPDIFTFNFLGYSGKFFFDQATKEPILQSFDDLKIEVVGLTNQDLSIHGFVITDTQGTKYYFGRNSDNTVNSREKSEQIVTNFYQFNSDSHTNTSPGYYTGEALGGLATVKWNLLEIKDLYGNIVTFEYDFEQLNHKKRLFDGLLDPLTPTILAGKRLVSLYGNVTGTQRFLRKIKFKGGEVEFISALNPRQDMGHPNNLGILSPRYIEQIKIKNYQNEIIKTFNLGFEYVENNDISNTFPIYHNENKKRLFLKSVQEITGNNESLPPHQLIYSDILLPNRFSNSIDWWGFYNGKQNGNTYDLLAMPNDLTSQITYMFNGGREIDSEKSQAGMLKKIIYPSGGCAEYEYEPNECMTPYFMKNTFNFFRNPSEMKGIGFFESNTYKVSPPGVQEVYETEQFTINENAVYPTDENSVYINWTNQGGFSMEEGTPIVDRPFLIQIICEELFTAGGLEPENLPLPVVLDGGSDNKILRGFRAGKYRIRATRIKEKTGTMPDFSVSLHWREETVPAYTIMYIGGNRIKKVVLKDKDEKKIEKKYKYNIFGSNQSSGMLFGFPYIYTDFTSLISINSVHPTPILHAGYSHVTEYIEGEETRQKIEYLFTSNPNEGDFFTYPLIPQAEYDWVRGKPLEIKYYKTNNNTTFSLQKEIITEYNFPWFLSLDWIDPNYIDRALFPTAQTTPVPYDNDKRSYFLNIPRGATSTPNGGMKYLIISGGHISIKSVTEKNYFGNNVVIEKQEFKNDSPVHLQVTEVSKENSEGTVFTTKYFYPGDSQVSGEPNIAGLTASNIIHPPLVVETDQDNKLSETKIQYKNWTNGTGSFLAPEIIKASKGANPLEDRIKYLKYDIYGNPLEVKQENGMHICYIYGYNNSLPVAKLENIEYNQIPANLITDIQNSTNSITNYSEQTVLNKLNDLRNSTNANIKKAMITTYTYKPLVGVTSITDPRGYKTTYEYDSFGRLKLVKDNNGNILSENQYNYRPQN